MDEYATKKQPSLFMGKLKSSNASFKANMKKLELRLDLRLIEARLFQMETVSPGTLFEALY